MKRPNQYHPSVASTAETADDVIRMIRRGNAALRDEELERLREAARRVHAERRSRRRADARAARKQAGTAGLLALVWSLTLAGAIVALVG
jgi:hypothetical protein